MTVTLLYMTWVITFMLVIKQSAASGNIEGYGAPNSICVVQASGIVEMNVVCMGIRVEITCILLGKHFPTSHRGASLYQRPFFWPSSPLVHKCA